ncbi:DUF4190 domain-containing protein [Actinoplanes sp. CA-252034]|uniref:DUF4190 domain-containing protein n=1 Tax=Actinoplanes sp. CA-252034 TaxID=3239906 RepID=UPI003D988022
MHNQVPPDPTQPPPYGPLPPYTPSDLPPQAYPGPQSFVPPPSFENPPPFGNPPPPFESPQSFGNPPQSFGNPPHFGPFPGYPPPPPPPGPSGLAVGALVASICGGPFLGTVLGFVLGIAALVQLRRRPQPGFGLAVAALVISGITLIISIGIVTGVVLSEVRDRVAGIEDVEATDLKTGDCISDLDDAERVFDMPVVSCIQPHRAEVYHVYQFPAGDFPGLAAVEEQSEERCGTAFEPYDTEENADLEVYFLFPESALSWRQDRSVLCLVEFPTARTTPLVK